MVYAGILVCPPFLYWLPNPAVPRFLLDGAFLKHYATYPGGPVECVTALLMQFYYWRWAGAAVISLAAVLLCLSLGAYIRAATGRRPWLVQFIPALLLVLLYDRYVVTLSITLSLLCATAGAWFYAGRPWERAGRRAALLVALGLAIYYAAGGGFLVYAALCGGAELRKRRWVGGAFCVACGALVPFVVGMLALGLWQVDAYGRLLPNTMGCDLRGGPAAVLYWLSVPAVGAATALWSAIVPGPWFIGFRWRLAECIVVVLLVTAAAVPMDRTARVALQLNYLMAHRRWSDVVRVTDTIPIGLYVVAFIRAGNRALYHQGLLAEDMFAHPPQLRHGLLPSVREMREAVYSSPLRMMQLSDVMWDLGRVNEAQHMAQEVCSVVGPHPPALLRLAMAEIAKRRPRAARPFLQVLAKDPIWGRRARELLKRFDSDPYLSDDPEIKRVRAVMPTEDTAGVLDAEELLLQLLARNPRNRMAFEYLMGHYLLEGRLDDFVANLSRLDDLDYEQIPRSYQEGLMVYIHHAGRAPDLGGRSISGQTARGFEGFLGVMRRHAGDRVAAWREALRNYRRTYFFYYWFVRLAAEDRQ